MNENRTKTYMYRGNVIERVVDMPVDMVDINPGEPGYYWVVVDGRWQPAEWNGHVWNFIFIPGTHCFQGIGERIPRPEAPPRYGTAPVKM
jgi:hypothetical protein